MEVLAGARETKFLAYEMHVAQFEMWGVPKPAVSVLVAGVIERLAVILFVLGAASRFGVLGLTSVTHFKSDGT